MRRHTLLLVALFLLALSSCSATLRVQATAPTADNDGTCAVPVLIAAGVGAPRMMHFQYAGAAAGEDSIATTAGTTVVFARSVPAGSYVVRAWASDAGGAGCRDSILVSLKAPPWRVVFP